MLYYWDSNKQELINKQTWRRQQIKQYMVHNLVQTQGHSRLDKSTISQPETIMRYKQPWKDYRKTAQADSTSKKGLSLSPMILYDKWKPLKIQWDMRLLPDKDTHNWRRVQLSRYIEKYPLHKPKHVLEQLNSHNQNP